MTIVLQALFLVAMILASAISNADTLTIVVRPAVNLDTEIGNGSIENTNAVEGVSKDLTLAEIVDAATIPAEKREAVMRHLKAVVLTDRPGSGEERSFSQEGLEAITGEATRRLEAAGFTIEWKIPRRSQVFRKVTFNRETIKRMLEKDFGDRCGGCEVSILRLDLPSIANLKYQTWRLAPRSDRPRGSFAVPVEFDGAKTLMITGHAEFFLSVPIATRAIQGGEKIGPTDFKMDRRNVTYSFDAPANVKDFESSVTARGLAVGDVFWKASVRREQVLRFGDPVHVQTGGETWSVSSDGISQSTAAVGDIVRVKVGKNQKLVSGVLKEKGLVEIR
jgi:flagella basal body P-ring formation protein FlgA